MATAALKRNAHARGYSMGAKSSRNRQTVTLRTIAAEIGCAISKAAERLARWSGGRQRVKARTGAPGGLSRVISAAYGLGFNRSRPNSKHHPTKQSKHHTAKQSKHHIASPFQVKYILRIPGKVYSTYPR